MQLATAPVYTAIAQLGGTMSERPLRFHALHHDRPPAPAEIEVAPTKAPANPRDLVLACSRGVAHAGAALRDEPRPAARFAARANLVAVISDGSPLPGLGSVGGAHGGAAA
jgi:malate dehydrogenase (oxaloacetate-decarboxylating)(NADP+)